MPIDLIDYGWSSRLDEAVQPYRDRGLAPGRISLEHTHIYRVVTADGEILARVAGRLRHRAAGRADFPVVGDWVAVERPPHGGDARIRAVLPRTSRFSRRAAGDPTEEQVVAANIDTVFLVAGLDQEFNPRRIERYLVVAWESGAAPVVVLNKADLIDDPAGRVEAVRTLAPAVPIYAISCRRAGSLEPLRAHLGPGRAGALLGSSGVGKSSIVNSLAGEAKMRTADVREADSKGRHTSTNRQLVLLPASGGLLIDTPGMREIQLWETGGRDETFGDVAALAVACRFRDCRHLSEPGCAVIAAAEDGTLAPVRLESFRKLAAEQAHAARQQDARALLEEKRRGRIGAKALSRRLEEKGRS